MKIETKEIESGKLDTTVAGIVILPLNYLSDRDHEYHSTVLSFYKYAKHKLAIDFLTKPEFLAEQRSGDWFGPILLFTSSELSGNPDLISIACGVISTYLTDFFKGQKTPTVKLKIVYKQTKTSKLTEISYEGDISGLDKLKDAVLKVAAKDSGND